MKKAVFIPLILFYSLLFSQVYSDNYICFENIFEKCISHKKGNNIYLKPEMIFPSNKGIVLDNSSGTTIVLPILISDNQGVFISSNDSFSGAFLARCFKS